MTPKVFHTPLATFARKSSNVQNLFNFFVAIKLWEPYARNAKKSGVTMLVSEISCVVDHAKLPNLVTVAVVGFI